MALLLRRGQVPQIKWRPTQFEQGQTLTMPAPYGGLNLRDDITSLQPNEARVLVNWISKTGELNIRPGYTEHVTGLVTAVKTLAAHIGSASNKMIAGANGKIYNVSTTSASELATGFTENRWQTACYNGYTQLVNGTDAPQRFNGSAVSTAPWTGSGGGFTATNLINVSQARSRLWFCEKNSPNVWYGTPLQVAPGTALSKLELAQVAQGGYCMAVGSWSRDAGDGADDYVVFVMSTGELLVYQGDVDTSFSLVGRYFGAPPVGRQCLTRVGGELLIITRLGLLPISAAVGGVALDLSRIDPWGKVAPGVARDVELYGNHEGWHTCLHDGILYVNVPRLANSISGQRVLNTRNGSWSDYDGWNATALCSYDNDLYFGGPGGKIWKVGGASDNGIEISASANTAFIAPSQGYRSQMFTAVRPKVQAEGVVTGIVGVDTDYRIRPFVGNAVTIFDDVTDSRWDTSPWNTSPWGRGNAATPNWYSVQGEGRSVSVRLRAAGATGNTRWYATDILYKPGGIR